MVVPTPELQRGLRLEERAPSITTLIVDATKSGSSGGATPISAIDMALSAAQAEVTVMQPSRFSGFAADVLHALAHQQSSPFAAASVGDEQQAHPVSQARGDSSGPKHLIAAPSTPLSLSPLVQQHLQTLLPEVLHGVIPELLPSLLPGAMSAALPVASAAAASMHGAAAAASVPAVLDAALPAALAATLPKAVAATLSVLIKTAAAGALPTSDVDGSVKNAAAQGERQPSMDQQGAAEMQLVRMLFGADSVEAPVPAQRPQPPAGTVKPPPLEIAAHVASGAAAPASGASSPSGSAGAHAASRPDSPDASAVAHVEQQQPAHAWRPSSATGHQDLGKSSSGPVVPANAGAASPRVPSMSAFAAVAETSAASDIYARRLSDTHHGPTTVAAARPPQHQHQAAHAGAAADHKAHHHHHHHHHANGHAPVRTLSRGSGSGSAGGNTHHSWGHAEDALSSVEDALSVCSGGDVPSPYHELHTTSSVHGTGAAVNSATNSFLLTAGDANATEAAAVAATELYGVNRDTLMDRLQRLQLQPQQQQQQQIEPAAPTAEELLMVAAGRSSLSQVASTQAATAAATAAAFIMQQQQAQQQAQQQQAQQQAAAAAAAQQLQQMQQIQQLQALVSGRGLSEQALGAAAPQLGATDALPWRRGSGTDTGLGFGGGSGDLWQSDADALNLAAASLALGQQQQQQQAVAAGLLQQQQQQQQQQLLAQSLAAVAAANRPLRAEDILAFGGGAGGLQLPAGAATGLGAASGAAAAAAQLAAAAAAAAAPGAAAADLATYMDAALRRMLLVSPQVASEMARACGAFSGAHAQLHHLCCVIAEQLLDVAAMAPEVAAALLRALAAHRARGAQATDVDPRVMGRVLQLLRAGPAGRQLCLVSLEQWVDGLSRIHKRRAYLDTILHNYQLTLKRLVQAMGHQVHAVNMSLPRQLLNDLSPRALLLLTSELAPYPLLQPRRWSEEIIWTITQLHAMGIDMPASGAPAAPACAAGNNAAPTSAFQWEVRRALAATADDIAAAGGAAVACGQTSPGAASAGALAVLGLGGTGSQAGSGSTTPGGTAVPWAAHAALHRHLLLGLRRVQTRFFSDRLRSLHGLYGEAVEALLRSSLPQDVLVPEREVVVLVAVLLMLECRMRPEDFDAAFGRDLQRCLAVSPVEEVAARLRCGLVPDSPLRIDPHKSRALSQLLKLGTLPGQSPF